MPISDGICVRMSSAWYLTEVSHYDAYPMPSAELVALLHDTDLSSWYAYDIDSAILPQLLAFGL